MKQFNKFYFKSFEFDYSNLKATFHYSFDNEVFFKEIINFNNSNFIIRKDLDIKILNNILFHLHIALGISYYKSFPTSELIIESGFLDDFQLLFWKNFYINGLGEFLYTNNISPEWLFNFINKSDKTYLKKDFIVSKKALVAIWWWKDSIVSIELLKNAWINFDLCVFWKNDFIKNNTAEVLNKNILLIQRELSDNLFELNKNWYYNWHVPITWIIAFVLEAVSYIYDYKYIVLSNEKSANYWNTSWKWLNINHQYSKSLDFEKDFGDYVDKYISSNIKYFSLLRWMYEIKIAELFSELWKNYFNKFSSCNNNFKIINKKNNIAKWWIWCNSCSKCAFVFSILRPFLNNKEVIDIFWEDLFNNRTLENTFKELLWISWIKPFECVWEAEEVIYSMYKSLSKYKINDLPFVLQIFKQEIFANMNKEDIRKLEKKLVRIYDEDIIPSELKKIIFKNIN